MTSLTHAGRIAGALLLLVFALGVLTFQFLQSPVLSGIEHFEDVAASSTPLVASALTGIASGSLSILVAVLLLPVFRRVNEWLAYAYMAFAVVNFVAIAIDTVSVLSVLEASRLSADGSVRPVSAAAGLVPLLYRQQWWTHHLYLLTSCLPVLALYVGLYVSRGVPRALSLFGVLATLLMAAGVAGAMMESRLNDMVFLPIALVQVATPLWLIARGLSIAESACVGDAFAAPASPPSPASP